MPDDGRSPALIDIAVERRSGDDREKLGTALMRLAAEDPSFSVKTDEESGQTIISSDTEAHLEDVVDRLQAVVAVNVGAPQVAYREVITRGVEHDYTHKRQYGGSPQFARIKFRIEPNALGAGFEFKSDILGTTMRTEYVAAVRAGVASVMDAGPVIGFPILGLRYTLKEGTEDELDSSPLAFEIAGRAGFKEAIEKGAPKVLEPIMQVEVVVPETCVGDAIGDLNSRRGQIRGTAARGISQVVDAMVPLATMLGYAGSLRALSRGLGSFEMRFSHYEQVPSSFDPDDRFPPAMAMRA